MQPLTGRQGMHQRRPCTRCMPARAPLGLRASQRARQEGAAGARRTVGAVLLHGLATAGEREAVDLVLDLRRGVSHEDGAAGVAAAHLAGLALRGRARHAPARACAQLRAHSPSQLGLAAAAGRAPASSPPPAPLAAGARMGSGRRCCCHGARPLCPGARAAGRRARLQRGEEARLEQRDLLVAHLGRDVARHAEVGVLKRAARAWAAREQGRRAGASRRNDALGAMQACKPYPDASGYQAKCKRL